MVPSPTSISPKKMEMEVGSQEKRKILLELVALTLRLNLELRVKEDEVKAALCSIRIIEEVLDLAENFIKPAIAHPFSVN
ncbi:hypothetical protein VNO77_09934 [Canavalia gladiata]|uniref:Uncharacterized protein n=1 Tax=Canavalia gladiata TaxID=3824 RepID=A0AAN9M9T4_CANGL